MALYIRLPLPHLDGPLRTERGRATVDGRQVDGGRLDPAEVNWAARVGGRHFKVDAEMINILIWPPPSTSGEDNLMTFVVLRNGFGEF
jgi:hypothetical protein